MSEYNSYREAGYQARNDGAAQDACPYSHDSAEAKAWHEGWQDAEGGVDIGTHTTGEQQHVLDEHTYVTKPTLDPRMTHVGFTQEQEQEMIDNGEMTPPVVDDATTLPAARPGAYVKPSDRQSAVDKEEHRT